MSLVQFCVPAGKAWETQMNKNDMMNVGTPKMEAMGFISARHKSVFFCYNRMCEPKKRFISPGSGGLAVLGHSDIWQSGEGLLLHQPLTEGGGQDQAGGRTSR